MGGRKNFSKNVWEHPGGGGFKKKKKENPKKILKKKKKERKIFSSDRTILNI